MATRDYRSIFARVSWIEWNPNRRKERTKRVPMSLERRDATRRCSLCGFWNETLVLWPVRSSMALTLTLTLTTITTLRRKGSFFWKKKREKGHVTFFIARRAVTWRMTAAQPWARSFSCLAQLQRENAREHAYKTGKLTDRASMSRGTCSNIIPTRDNATGKIKR